MDVGSDVDGALLALGARGRYQILQLVVVSLGAIGAAYQLLSGIFTGRAVGSYSCAPPENASVTAPSLTTGVGNSSLVTYGQCHVTVAGGNQTTEEPCPFGYSYGYPREMSFRTEFDLVCDRKLLGSLAQSFVILGQGFGAVGFSFISDRWGRKKTAVGCQLGLFAVGTASGLVPGYATLAVCKFLAGAFQQGVATSTTTMSLELFPANSRLLQALAGSAFWGVCCSSLALVAWLMRLASWRWLQGALSAASLAVGLLQAWYVDESLRWLLANRRREAAMAVLKRASRVNDKDLATVVSCLQATGTRPPQPDLHTHSDGDHATGENGTELRALGADVRGAGDEVAEARLSVLDIFRHRVLLLNGLVIWTAWFTCALSFFALYMMSTTLHGNRFLNYFLTALMEVPPGFIFVYIANRFGRKQGCCTFFIMSGLGLVGGGVCRIFQGVSAVAWLPVVFSMLGMLGASGMFGGLYFYTPEAFPTNMRNQALGLASSIGRVGGMLAPFMADLAEVAVWAPGAMIGSLCCIVVLLFRFLPETKGRELPHTISEIEVWKEVDQDQPKK